MKIDGKAIPYMWQETILDAATRAGIFIPSLCTDTTFNTSNSCCRLCLVEITEYGRTWIAGACETVSQADMEIRTDTDELRSARETVLQLLYAEAPGSNKIKELMERCGVCPDPGITLKGGRDCILCGNCASICHYYIKGAVERVNRGVSKKIDTPYGKANDECRGCATCEIVCPVGSIESTDACGRRTIWHKDFELIYCEECGKLITTKENYSDAIFEDAPQLCHECSEKYRKAHRNNRDISNF